MSVLRASFEVVGIVSEARELSSEKNKTWKGYVCKVITAGFTAEVNLTEQLFKQVGDGQHVMVVGHFEERSVGEKGFRALKLIADRVAPYVAAKGGAA